MSKYENGVTKRLCRDCSFCKRRFNASWCKIYQDNKGGVLGIYEWFDTPHPKCPLKNITYKKLLGIAHRFRYKDGWAYYQAKELGIEIPKGGRVMGKEIYYKFNDYAICVDICENDLPCVCVGKPIAEDYMEKIFASYDEKVVDFFLCFIDQLALTEKALELACDEQDLYWFSKYADRDGIDLVEWLKIRAKEMIKSE